MTACGGESSTSPSARAELRAAIDKTLAADSLHVERQDGGTHGRASIDFNAPDRVREVSGEGPARSESIIVGNTAYISDGHRPGFYLSSELPGDLSPADTVLTPLQSIRDLDDVATDGEDFVVRPEGDRSTTARLRIDGGFVVRLHVRSSGDEDAIDVVYEFSQFGSAPEVTAPAADKVSPAPVPPKCSEDVEPSEGVVVCTGGTFEAPREIDLPTVRSGDSRLQFRPVRGDAGSDCPPRDANPPAREVANMPNPDGGCLMLAEAALEVSRVRRVRATTTDGQRVALDITLLSADAKRFDSLAAAHYGQRLALVIFGRVVSAPTIRATEFHGKLALSPLSIEDAGRIKATLLA